MLILFILLNNTKKQLKYVIKQPYTTNIIQKNKKINTVFKKTYIFDEI